MSFGLETWLPLLRWLTAHTYALIFVGMVIDATGIPFPGRLLLVVGGSLAARGEVDIFRVVAAGALGAAVGDHVWYLAGRLNARRIMRWYCRLTLSSGRSARQATEYLKRWGGAAILAGRFVAGVRILAWPLAGSAGLGYGRFLAYDLLGALIWSGLFAGLGYTLGDRWIEAARQFPLITLVVVVLAVLGALVLLALRFRRARHSATGLPAELCR
jgi:membrane protein DedA with SNARE-associated domain